MAVNVVKTKQVSIALACRTFQISETCYRYERKFDDEKAEIADLAGASDGQSQDMGLWSVLFVSAQREGL
tara:strand:- start:348 stop:557 length:210 start_codon:yes stop_codon:yes gene_type:complete